MLKPFTSNNQTNIIVKDITGQENKPKTRESEKGLKKSRKVDFYSSERIIAENSKVKQTKRSTYFLFSFLMKSPKEMAV